MKRGFVVLMTGLFLISASLVFAEGECDKYKTSYDVTYCYSKLFVESDKELNSVYNDLKGVLKDDMKKKLTETQRGWIKYRNSACEEAPGTINVDCNYKVNRDRTEYLRDRLRECKAGTCRNDMIVKKTWH